jgi:hypothetical protein
MHPKSKPIPRICQHCGSHFLAKANKVRAGRGRFCSVACKDAGLTQPVEDRFWAKVEQRTGHFWDGTECWDWTAKRNKQGYGQFYLSNPERTVLAHRLAYELQCGPIPAGLDVCHHCDRPACIRGEHLFPGTNKENMEDCVAKGRIARGETNASRLYPERVPRGETHAWRKHPELVMRGERNPASKLTATIVREVRMRHAREKVSAYRLAREYGVSKQAILAVLHRETWRHVE